MEKKFIVKNVWKYNQIVLARGLNLMRFSTTKRTVVDENSTGVSTRDYGNVWFLIPKNGKKQKALFKSFSGKFANHVRNIRIYNELLCQELCKQLGISCAECERAEVKGRDGLVSYNIIGKNERLISLFKFVGKAKGEFSESLKDLSEVIDYYIGKGYYIDKKQMLVDLYKIIVFDALTFQTDRHSANVNLLFDKSSNSFRVAPLFDNEFAFGLMQLKKLGFSQETNFEDLMTNYGLDGGALFEVQEYYGRDGYTKVKQNIENIVLYAKKHHAFKTVLEDMLKNINIQSSVKTLADQYQYMNQEYIEYITELVDYTKKLLADEKHKRVPREEIEDLQELY